MGRAKAIWPNGGARSERHWIRYLYSFLSRGQLVETDALRIVSGTFEVFPINTSGYARIAGDEKRNNEDVRSETWHAKAFKTIISTPS